jgi:NPCBM/NEW2 domain
MPIGGHDGLGGQMLRGRKLFWMIIGSAVAAVAAVIAFLQVNPGTSPKAASSPVAGSSSVPHISASESSQAGKEAPVVIPRTSSTSSFSYISDLTPSSNLGELIYPGPVKIYGLIYPNSISFSCDNGDLPAFPAVYRLKHSARRFQATVGVEAQWPSDYLVGVSLLGDGRTLLSFSVSVRKPRTVDVNVTGVHILTLECFTPGISSAASSANIEVAWGNARVTEGH